MKRTSSAKGQVKRREIEVPQTRQQNKGHSNGGLTVAAAAAKSPSNKKQTETKSAQTQASSPVMTQTMYDSRGLKDAMVKEYGGSQYVNVDNEAEYYEAVKKLDTCGKCWAGQQKYYTGPFKVNHKGPGQTLYQKDFVKHPLSEQGPVLKNDFYSTWNNNVPVDYGTTNKNDFKNWNASAPKRETMNWKPATSDIPFAGTSNYRTDYANWGANLVAHEKAPQNKTVISELPFMAHTTYGDEFGMPTATSQLKPVDRDLWRKKEKSPITTGIPFLGESMSASTYKPFKVCSAPSFKPAEEYVPTKTLPEHMRSLYAKDFGAKPSDKCPAAIFMEQNSHPKFKHLSA